MTRVVVPDGEACKCAAVLTDVWEALGAFRMGRDGCLIGLGGGATTDLAGFAAASWLRGVPPSPCRWPSTRGSLPLPLPG